MNSDDLNSDENLLLSIQGGDRNAFAIIYSRYAKSLFDYAYKRIGDKEECENIIQDIFESLWLRHEQLKITSLRHYLFNAARYMVIRYFYVNRMKQKHAEHFRVFSDVYDTLEPEDRDPEKVRDTIVKSLQGLPTRCEEAMTLRVIENLPYAEIASRMNISRKTVELYISKALAHLRERLKKGVDW